MKHILMISQYFYPEQFRINDICQEWVKKGYKVTVLTGIPNYPQGKYYPGYGLFRKRKEKYEGMNIIRIPLVPRGNRSIMLALNYLSFVISGWLWALFTKVKADYVFIYEVSPMTQALPGVWYSRRRKIPCYLYVMDPWPENVQIMTGISNPLIINPLAKMTEYIYRNCDKIFISSRKFIESTRKRKVPDEKVEYWPQYAEDFYQKVEQPEVSEIPQDGVFNLTFAGNIGQAQGLDVLPEAAKIIKQAGTKARFNIIGEGRYKQEFLDLVKSNGVDEMFNFIDKQPATKIPEFMAVSDAALVTLSKSDVFSMVIPAKVQSCLACGIPIVVAADGEVQNVIKEAKAGVCSDSGDSEALATNILNLLELSKEQRVEMAKNAKKYSELHFNKNKLLEKMDKFFAV